MELSRCRRPKLGEVAVRVSQARALVHQRDDARDLALDGAKFGQVPEIFTRGDDRRLSFG